MRAMPARALSEMEERTGLALPSSRRLHTGELAEDVAEQALIKLPTTSDGYRANIVGEKRIGVIGLIRVGAKCTARRSGGDL